MNCKTKSFMTKRKAFTLIELLIVIAIIGILFIVLVSKVDFATDKAKATGVQTDFRSFQLAFDTVAKENAGFNTFGWDTGDANQNGKRDSYDEGDNGAGGGIAQNGIQDGTEVFTGHKVYAETFTKVFSLKKNGTGAYDRDALNRLETAINANLDPKLHITIKDDGEIVMANGAQDPWSREYHGQYYSAEDGKDRGAIFMYSDGPNNAFGSAYKLENGVATVYVPNGNKNGKDDYSLVSCYTYLNGYGEVLNATTGFSNNQSFLAGDDNNYVIQDPSDNGNDSLVTEVPILNTNYLNYQSNEPGATPFVRIDADAETLKEVLVNGNPINNSNYDVYSGSTIVILKTAYMKTLSTGEYELTVVFEDDSMANINFTVDTNVVCLHTDCFAGPVATRIDGLNQHYNTWHCNDCGESFIGARNDCMFEDWDGNPQATCAYCGEIREECINGHDWQFVSKMFVNFNVEYHYVCYGCTNCGASYSEEEPCVFNNGWCECGNLSMSSCNHTFQYYGIVSGNDGTHSGNRYCDNCTFGESFIEDCIFEGNVCTLCGYIAQNSCLHSNMQEWYMSGDGTTHHYVRYCPDCSGNFGYDEPCKVEDNGKCVCGYLMSN